VRQHTIAEAVSCTGSGPRSGAPVRLHLHPAPPDSGVVFASSAREAGGAPGATPLMAALFGLGIDNLRVEIDGPELPAMDGSAAPFVYLLRSAGVVAQSAERRVLRVRRPIEVRDGARVARIEPARSFRIDYAVDSDHPAIGRQAFRLDGLDPQRFEREIAGARGFEFARDTGSGGSLASAVRFDDDGIANPEGLRWPDEFVRHCMLSLLGDLARLGVAVQGQIRVAGGRPSLHRRLVAAIAAAPERWRLAPGVRGAGFDLELPDPVPA